MHLCNTGSCSVGACGGHDPCVHGCVLGTHLCKLYSAPPETHTHLHLQVMGLQLFIPVRKIYIATHSLHPPLPDWWLWVLGALERLQVAPSPVNLCRNAFLYCLLPRLRLGDTGVCGWRELPSSKRPLPRVPLSGRPSSLPASCLPQRPLWSPAAQHLLQDRLQR